MSIKVALFVTVLAILQYLLELKTDSILKSFLDSPLFGSFFGDDLILIGHCLKSCSTTVSKVPDRITRVLVRKPLCDETSLELSSVRSH